MKPAARVQEPAAEAAPVEEPKKRGQPKAKAAKAVAGPKGKKPAAEKAVEEAPAKASKASAAKATSSPKGKKPAAKKPAAKATPSPKGKKPAKK
jgi:hypothetical protein